MNRYDFTDTKILEEQANLASYFHQKKFAPDTIKTYCNYTGYFLEWLEINPKSTTYNDLLQFVNYCKSEGRKTKHINTILTAVRHYFNMLQSRSAIRTNPATGLHVRG